MSVIRAARCSALVRERPMVVMTCWSSRLRRTSQIRSGGRPLALAEPVSISTVMGCMAKASLKLAVCWELRTRQGWATRVRASSYEVHQQWGMLGDGRQIHFRPAAAAVKTRVRPPRERWASVAGGAEVRVDLAGDVRFKQRMISVFVFPSALRRST